jgi:Na+-translocating ferredoxin:NAD+ oxidoreductase subunit G
MKNGTSLFVHILLTLTLIGLVSGGVLSLVNAWAAPLIAENQRQATERAIFLVQPESQRYELLETGDFTVFRVFDESNQPLGYALVHGGQGFQSTITLVIGVSSDLATITGIEVLDQNETPGLGTVIKEEGFLSQFLRMSVAEKIGWVKGPPADGANQVQVVTGATVSTRAVVEIVNEGIAELRRLEGAAP